MLGALLEMPTPKRSRGGVSFGKRLRGIRERRGLTQKEAADRIGISVDGYRHWEHGRSQGLLQFLDPTASAFGLSVSQLMAELGFYDKSEISQDGAPAVSADTLSAISRRCSRMPARASTLDRYERCRSHSP